MPAVLSTVLTKHPRYSIAFAIIFLLVTVYWIPYISYSSTGRIVPSYFSLRISTNELEDALAREEEEYQKYLERREAMVLEYGPTAEEVDSYVFTQFALLNHLNTMACVYIGFLRTGIHIPSVRHSPSQYTI